MSIYRESAELLFWSVLGGIMVYEGMSLIAMLAGVNVGISSTRLVVMWASK